MVGGSLRPRLDFNPGLTAVAADGPRGRRRDPLPVPRLDGLVEARGRVRVVHRSEAGCF